MLASGLKHRSFIIAGGIFFLIASLYIADRYVFDATMETQFLFVPSHDITLIKDLSYGPSPQEKLDICQPKDLNAPRPTVILIHGGCWTGGDKKNRMSYLCDQLAQVGFIVANINYRLASPNERENQWPAQLEDAQLAVRWLRAHAKDYHLLPQSMAAVGASSGGQLALFLGALKKNFPGDRMALYGGETPDVEAVVDDQGIADLTLHSPLLNACEKVVFPPGAGKDFATLLREASPLFHLGPDMAPTLIVQGDIDNTALPQQSRALRAALEKMKVPVEFISYHGSHNYQGLTSPEIAALLQKEVHYLVTQFHP